MQQIDDTYQTKMEIAEEKFATINPQIWLTTETGYHEKNVINIEKSNITLNTANSWPYVPFKMSKLISFPING